MHDGIGERWMKCGMGEQIIEQINDIFAQFPTVESVVLYGSRAMGNWKNGSDIDLCVRGNQVTLRDLLAIDNRIDDLLLPHKVDLSLFHKIENPDLLDHIQRVGKPFYVRGVTTHAPDCKAA